MHQWVFLLALVAATLVPKGIAAAQLDGGAATELYAAASSQQKVQLRAGSTADLLNGPVEVKQRLVVQGTASNPALIRCSNNAAHAFLVRGATLELQDVVLSGCSKQAIVLTGPGAVLRAKSVTFKDHGPADTSEEAAGATLPSLGLIIAATDAVVELTNVTIAENNGMRLSRGSKIPSWRPYLHLPCRDDTVSGGVSSWGSTSTNSSEDVTTKQQACGSPLLGSSLIDLEESTLVLRGTQLRDNIADALITARGSSAHSLQLLPGTNLAGNRARWLLVADSWAHDPVGRRNMKAPQPSEVVKGLDMQPPYTSYALMGQLRSQLYADANETESGARRRLQQQQAGQQQPQQGQRAQNGRQQQAPSQKRQQQQQQAKPEQGQQPPPQAQPQKKQGQQQQKPTQELQEVSQSLQQPGQQPLQQQPGPQEPEQQQVTPDSVVGKAPNGQVPLQLRFQGVYISHNVVQSGLLWLRLVNTSMVDTVITHNIGTGGKGSINRQLRAVAAALPLKAAAAVAEAGRAALQNDTDASEFAAKVAAAGSIVPPGPCDVGSLQRSLLIMHGPSAFDMLRTSVSHNIHFSGAIMRVTEGLGPTSMRDSQFVNNTATAVLRFEGRTWVLKTDTFFAGIQFLDVLFYTQFQGASQAAYKFAELQHAQQQASKDKVSYDAFWFMSNSTMINNTVFHSLVMSKGSRTSWRSFLAQKADILQSGAENAATMAKNLPLINLSTSWWMRGCWIEGNRLRLPPGSTTASSTSNTGPFSSKAGSPVRSRPTGTSATSNGSAVDADGDTGPGSAYQNEWIEAVPYAAYSDVLSAVLDADENLLTQLSLGGGMCYDALRTAVDQQQTQLTLQVMLRATAPAVLWASTTQGYIEDSTIVDNSGFFHTLRMDNAYVTWKGVTLANNSAAFSVFDLWFGDAWIEGADVMGNHVQAGSVWNFESFRGKFQEILLQGNKAGTARPSDLAGLMSDDNGCKKKTPKRPVLRGGRGGSVATPSSANAFDLAANAPSPSLSPIWRMSHFLGELHKATISNNTGSIALDISGMALAAPLTELLVQDNMASGIRLLLPEPKYDNQSIELYDVFVVRNSLSPAAPLVGGLLLGGFTSGVGATMPVRISNCVFVNNTPAQPVDTLTLQGGGLCIQGPASDSTDDPMSQHGFLQKLSITMTRTQVDGNMAAEGGGLWTAWPMIIEDCSFRNNHAVVSGGGIYSKGLQQDSLGAFGALIINHTMITNNTASFGGGIACDSCRAILAAQIDGNQAIRNVSLDNTTSNNWGSAPGGWGGGWGGSNGGSSGSSSSGCSNGTGSGTGSSSAGSYLNPRRLRHAVLGAGGGVAANLAGNSYVVICVSGNGTSIDDRGKSSLRNNTAQALGGAVYLNSTMIAPDCPFPQPGKELTETCFPGGYWPKKCGFNTLDLDWQGSMASAGGDLVAWAGDTAGFNMACTLKGPQCAFNGSALRDANVSASSGSGSDPEGRAAGQTAAISATGGSKPKGSKSCKGWDCKKGLPGAGSGNSTQQKMCVRTFDAQSPYVCAAGSGIKPIVGSNSNNSSSSRGVLLVDESRKFQLPATFYVYNTTCIQERNFSRSWQSCAVAGDLPHLVPRVFSGDTMELTVSLGTTQQRLHPTMRDQDAVIGIVQLQQSPDNSLFVIGDTRQQMQMGLAMFTNMALQPVVPPISNKEYEFRITPAWGAGNDLLRQVKPVIVTVKLLRCTLGMHMTINRCVRCSANGTYSLNPFTNETIGCQPCPNGGLCENGLLAPRAGYYSYNPFVPQIFPCPLKGGCTGRRRVGRGWSQAALQELQRETLGGVGASAGTSSGAASSTARAGVNWDASGRRLLAQGVDSTEGSEGPIRSSAAQQPAQRPSGHQYLSEGPDADPAQQQQQKEMVVYRRQALMGYNKLLAQLWANDSTDGMPLLMGVQYPDLLDAWHRLQCNPGYTGMFCGRCDLNYVEGVLPLDSYAAEQANPTAMVRGDRYGLHMGSCVKCQSDAVIGFALFGLFLLLFAYNAFGMCMQLRNSGIRDPYLRFIRAQQALQSQGTQQSQQPSNHSPQQQSQQTLQLPQQQQLQLQGSGQTSLPPSGSTNTLARDSSSSQTSQSQSQPLQMSHHGSSSNTNSQGSSNHQQPLQPQPLAQQQPQQQQQQQPSPIGHCYSVHPGTLVSHVSYGFAIPFTAVGGPHAGFVLSQGSVPPVSPAGAVQHPRRSAPGLSPETMYPQPSPTPLLRANTMPVPVMVQRQGSAGGPSRQGSGSEMLSPKASMGTPFLQQAHLPPLPPMYSQQQQYRQQLSIGVHPQQQQQQHRVSWGGSHTSPNAVSPAHGGPAGGIPRVSTMPHSMATQAHSIAAQQVQHGNAAAGAAGAAGAAAAGVPAAAAGSSSDGVSRSPSPLLGPPVGPDRSFVFTNQQSAHPDQQMPRDQQQPSPQGRWWGSNTTASPQQQQQSLPPLSPQQQSLPAPSAQQQYLQQQHRSVTPVLHHMQSSPQSVLQYSQSSVLQASSGIRHRYQSTALSSMASSQQQGSSGVGQHSSNGRGSGSAGANAGNSAGQQSGGSGGQQQQQAGFRKGPAGLLVGLWKVLTSYLQVLGTVRHISLRGLPEMSNQALAFADLSSFTSFVALDCLLPGPQEWHAFIKLFARTIALPILLLIASALMWTSCWLFRHFARRLHRKYSHRHTVRWQPLRRMQRQVSVAPDPFRAYLSPRMLITFVVLSYSLYPLVTSGLLYTLQCVYIPGPFSAVESAAVEYSRRHYDWLLARGAATNSSSSSSGSASAGQRQYGESDIQMCRPGQGKLESGLCWVTGRFWAMDYDVQCFVGHHRAVAMFGLVMLLLVGVCFPVAAAVGLWVNRKRLDEWDFAWKWSFLYAEYKPNACFWEFIIMGRKLAFLAATILLPMALDTPEETTAQMQLLVCVLLAVTFLLLHASLHPFKRGVLNRLERLGLTAIALSCTLLAASLVVEKGRTALLAILGVVNVVVVAIFLYHIIKQFWLWIGAPASKALGTMYKNGKVWWAGTVHSRLQQKLQGGLPKWPQASGWWGRCRSVLCGSSKGQQGEPDEKEGDDDDGDKGGSDAQQQQQPQQRKDPEQQVNGHAPPGSQLPKRQQQQPQGDAHLPLQQQQRKQQWGKLTWWMRRGSRQADQEAGLADAEAPDNAQQQQQANGHATPSQQQQQQQQANGHAPPAQQQQQQANGRVPSPQGDGVQPPDQQQQQQGPEQNPVDHQHGTHQLPLGNRRPGR